MTTEDSPIQARLENVRLTYDGGASWPLDGVTLSVRHGERVCILGPNGAGKTTLAQVLAGLEAPDEGRVELAGRLCCDGGKLDADAYRAARHATGLVFQNPEDQIVTSVVADDVAFGPENLGLARTEIERRVDEEIARVALGAYAQADPARLSGGQMQRVAIAGALAMHPSTLVLDEPGAMLDVRGRRGIMRVLGLLQEAGTTIVHVTHFMEEALAADRVLVLVSGKVALEGSPQDVFAHARELQEWGLDLPTVTFASLELGLRPCGTVDELASELAAHPVCAAALSAAPHQRVAYEPPAEILPEATELKGPALRLNHVSFSYEGKQALTDISLTVGAGEVVSLVGRTGSGKSTIARLACALAAPASGTVEVCGIPTTDRKRRREIRGRVGYVMQHPERQLFAETIREDIAYGPRNLGVGEDEVQRRVEALLTYLGLEGKGDVSPFELSGGQQRMVALAGVLAMKPSMLVLDEPVSGFDSASARRLRRLIRGLHAQGVAILMISHSMEDVAKLSDRIVVLDQGNVALTGAPAEVFSQAERLHELGLGIPAPLKIARGLEEAGAVPEGSLGSPLTVTELLANLRSIGGDAAC